jgi:ABC-type sugar transport system ATPase subunit
MAPLAFKKTNMATEFAVETVNLTKQFPGVLALDHVSIQVAKGECHALVGENGAGKSTLGKILGGLYTPEAGKIIVNGKEMRFNGPLQATHAGISIVHQELLFCENLSVADNLCLDAPPSRFGFVNQKEMMRRSREWLASMHVDVDPDMLVGALSVSRQQMVQIAGAVGKGAQVLIFDEPTSSLTQKETEDLFEQIRKLKAAGVTSIYVSHRLEEIFAICDRVTVLRDGKHIGTEPIASLDRKSIVKMMVGRDIETPAPRTIPEGSKEVLQVDHLSSLAKFKNISFSIKGGEILGLAGLVGSGRTEIAEAIFGLDPNVTGIIRVNGSEVTPKSPIQMMHFGVGLVPEDRKRHGLVLTMSCKENLSLPTLDDLEVANIIRVGKERSLANKYFQAMRIKAPNINTPSGGLSGGNQQKVVIGKWLAANCEVLIMDEPTRGVDVGAKSEIHTLIRQLADSGKAVLVISSELPELLALTNRIIAIHNGVIAGEADSADSTEESLLQLMTGTVSVG